MVKKYIVELESGTHIFVLGPEGITHIGEPDVVYETVDGMQIGDAVINAKPYTEPDLGQVRKYAYKIGYEKGYRDGVNRIGDAEDKIRKEAYQKGLSDAWDAARKICTNWVLPDSVLSEIFGMNKTIDDIMKETTASEAIEKIRQYEQRQEEQIQVGDEVIRHYKNEFMEGDDAPSIFLSEEDGHFRCLAFNGRSIMIAEYPKNQYRKTGRHFPEIAAVLEKMRGEQDG